MNKLFGENVKLMRTVIVVLLVLTLAVPGGLVIYGSHLLQQKDRSLQETAGLLEQAEGKLETAEGKLQTAETKLKEQETINQQLNEELQKKVDIEEGRVRGESPYAHLYPDFYAPKNDKIAYRETGVMYLTFDDGPSARTEEVLNILKEKVTVRFQRADSYETKTFLLEDLNSRKDESADAPGAGVGWAAEGREGQAEQQGEGAEKDKSPDNQAERQGEPRPPKRPKGPKPAGNKDQAGTRNGETRPARAGGEKAEQGHKLGQPVRRENTKKPGAQNGSSAGSTANGGNAGGGTEKQPAAQPKKNASNWAQELEKAMQAIDRN